MYFKFYDMVNLIFILNINLDLKILLFKNFFKKYIIKYLRFSICNYNDDKIKIKFLLVKLPI